MVECYHDGELSRSASRRDGPQPTIQRKQLTNKAREVFSRFNVIFYLGTIRYIEVTYR